MEVIRRVKNKCNWNKNGECTCPACLTIYKDKFLKQGHTYCLNQIFLKETEKKCNFFQPQ